MFCVREFHFVAFSIILHTIRAYVSHTDIHTVNAWWQPAAIKQPSRRKKVDMSYSLTSHKICVCFTSVSFRLGTKTKQFSLCSCCFRKICTDRLTTWLDGSVSMSFGQFFCVLKFQFFFPFNIFISLSVSPVVRVHSRESQVFAFSYTQYNELACEIVDMLRMVSKYKMNWIWGMFYPKICIYSMMNED